MTAQPEDHTANPTRLATTSSGTLVRLLAVVVSPLIVLLAIAFFTVGGDPDASAILVSAACLVAAAAGNVVVFFLSAAAIVTRHPAFDTGYAAWLKQSPWKPGAPLVRGPIRLGVQQLLIAAAVALPAVAAIPFTPKAFYPAVAPLLLLPLGAAASLHLANARTGQGRYLSIVLGVAAAIGFVAPTWVCLLTIPWIAYLTGLAGAASAMRRFPWPEPQANSPRLGLPYADLLESPSPGRLSVYSAVLWGFLTCATIASFCEHITLTEQDAREAPGSASLLCGVGSLFLMVIRAGAYSTVICPRLCWGERVGAGRWIVPRHDVIFAVLLAIPLAGSGLTFLLAGLLQAPPHLAAAIGMGAAVAITLGAGPTTTELHYTGRHEITQRPANNTQRKNRPLIQVNA